MLLRSQAPTNVQRRIFVTQSKIHGPRAQVRVHAAKALDPSQAPSSPSDSFKLLQGLQVLRATDGSAVELVQQWGPNERVLVAWTRSLGCPFCQALAVQLTRDVKPKLDSMDTKLYMVSIGTPERSKDFVARTGFPADRLFLDPDNVTYNALGLTCTLQETFFNPVTPLSLFKRMSSGEMGDLWKMLDGWEPWMTPNGPKQAMQQGGILMFQGDQLLYSYYDRATGDHADLTKLLTLAESVAATHSRGCDCTSAEITAAGK